MASAVFKVRPAPDTLDHSKATWKGASRLYVCKESLVMLTKSIEGGCPCVIESVEEEDPTADPGPGTPSTPSTSSTSTTTTTTKTRFRREATLWTLPNGRNVSPNVVQMVDAFRRLTGLELGERVRITVAGSHKEMPLAKTVLVQEIPPPPVRSDSKALHNAAPPPAAASSPADERGWLWIIGKFLERAGHVFPGMQVDVACLNVKKSFRIVTVNGSDYSNASFKASSALLTLRSPEAAALATDSSSSTDDTTTSATTTVPTADPYSGELALRDIPGYPDALAKLNDYLDNFTTPFCLPHDTASCGLVLHGGSGSGKTFLLDRLAATNWGRVFRLDPTDKLAQIQESFQQARTLQPSLVLLDDLDQMITPDRANYTSVINTLARELDLLAQDIDRLDALPKVVVVATCTDYYVDIPAKLQKPARFRQNILLPVPDPQGRLDILRWLQLPLASSTAHQNSSSTTTTTAHTLAHQEPTSTTDGGEASTQERDEQILTSLAQRTYAYNPGDLSTLVLEAKAVYKTRQRARASTATTSTSADANARVSSGHGLTMAEFDEALRRVKPSAMHDINLKPPVVHWQDIGGQERVKKALRTMIRHTEPPPSTTSLASLSQSLSQSLSLSSPSPGRVNPHRPKGVLLYGPPGCSKTLSAQALATESGFNFFSVKGAELLDKYVGESEKAVRTLFARARAAAPSIIFFDEIDSLATSRSGMGGGGSGVSSNSGSAHRSQAATNVLTSLLTEIDGFESLQGVLVVAATNVPEQVDAALLRPGRFSHIVYVAPPDVVEREAVLRVHTAKMPLADDVDFAELARRADGFSGADIFGACSNAADAVQELVDAGEREFHGAVHMADLCRAIEEMPKSISPEIVRRYEQWGASRVR